MWYNNEKQLAQWFMGTSSDEDGVNAGPRISFTIGKRDRKRIPLTSSITVNGKPANFSGECPIIFGNKNNTYKTADRYYISLRHYIGVDDQVRAEATEELAQENGEEIFVKFHQGTGRFMLSHSVTRREKSTSWQIKDTRRIRMWLELSLCKNTTIICTSPREEIVFRNGSTREELEAELEPTVRPESPLKKARSSSPSSPDISTSETQSPTDDGSSPLPGTSFISQNRFDGYIVDQTIPNHHSSSIGPYVSVFPNVNVPPVSTRFSPSSDKENKIDIDNEEKELFEQLKRIEMKYRVSPYLYTDQQPYVNLRFTAISWLILKGIQFKCNDEQIEVSVNIFDRFLFKHKKPYGGSLECLTVACLHLATKYGYDVSLLPTIDDFLQFTECSKAAFLETLSELQRSVTTYYSPPTPRIYLRRLLQFTSAEYSQIITANLLCDVAMLDSTFVLFRPSEIACSTYIVSAQIVGKKELWNPTLDHYTDYRIDNLQACRDQLMGSYLATQKNLPQCLRTKYYALLSMIPMFQPSTNPSLGNFSTPTTGPIVTPGSASFMGLPNPMMTPTTGGSNAYRYNSPFNFDQ